jgi:hypothetical protein
MKKDHTVDRQILIDRLLESENLTDNLEDDDANALINWGIAQVDLLVKDVQDEESAGVKINHLMSLMRQINVIAGNPSTVSEEKILKFLHRYAQTFNEARDTAEEEPKAVAEKLSHMQPGEIVKYLLEWMQSKKQ